ncbi:hypothetical protein RRF57_009942 [Xylaria bambusicola]|uniref:Uncharacterized protein n=1 Tax=Xylaria bambusicola TaxID=326684 RepID=A0AAN7URH1_9PEZI
MGNAIYLDGDKLQLLVNILVGRGVFDKATKSGLMVQYSCEELPKDNGRVGRLKHFETTGNAMDVLHSRIEFGNACVHKLFHDITSLPRHSEGFDAVLVSMN